MKHWIDNILIKVERGRDNMIVANVYCVETSTPITQLNDEVGNTWYDLHEIASDELTCEAVLGKIGKMIDEQVGIIDFCAKK